jgi:D-alanine-D-alanine ligase
MAKTRLVVLFGGQSAEHDVSCTSAAQLLGAIDRDRFEVLPVGITRQGQWVDARELLELRDPDHLVAIGPATGPLDVLHDAQTVVFPMLHGPLGEDGTIQGLLELAGVPYVGSGVLGAALAMDKAMAKHVIAGHGIAQPEWRALEEHQRTSAALDAIADALGFPMFVKPANLGSSVGISKVRDRVALDAAADRAFAYDTTIVCEEAIVGREIEVAVLGTTQPKASLPGEIVPSAEFYDYDDKYSGEGAKIVVPAPLDEHEIATVQEMALKVFAALRCDGIARVDFFYEAERSGRPGRGFLVNEANTMPGFTPYSMYPMMWAASGLPYDELVAELVELAIERHARRSAKRITGR